MATSDVCKNAKSSTTVVKHGTATVALGGDVTQTKEHTKVPNPTTPEGYEAKLQDRFDSEV